MSLPPRNALLCIFQTVIMQEKRAANEPTIQQYRWISFGREILENSLHLFRKFFSFSRTTGSVRCSRRIVLFFFIFTVRWVHPPTPFFITRTGIIIFSLACLPMRELSRDWFESPILFFSPSMQPIRCELLANFVRCIALW